MYERMYDDVADRNAGLVAKLFLAFFLGLSSLWLWARSAAELVRGHS